MLLTVLHRLRTARSDQRGFTMPTVMGAMLVVMLISIAAIASASSDINLSRYDQDDKQALAAAEAGVADYLAHLNADSNYWSKCTGVPSPVVQRGTTGAGRRWKDVPSSNSEYSIELIPAPGKSACDTADPVGSMINDGNVKIRVTGRVKRGAARTRNVRSINATFRRGGFLDFLYFTDLENQDPTYIRQIYGDDIETRSTNSSGVPDGGPDIYGFADDKCERHWRGSQASPGEGRGEMPQWRGQYQIGSDWYPEDSSFTLDTDNLCGEIQFADGDRVNGPFHSNDNIMVCGSPDFGRLNKNDKVEVSGTGWRASPGCGSADPTFIPPPLKTGVSELQPPPSNQTLEQVTEAGYRFTGPTEIELKGTTMDVMNDDVNGGTVQNMPLPPNGVIFVANDGCTQGYNPIKWYAKNAGCGQVRVKGTYSNDLTIAAQDDIVVMADTQRTGTSNALLGLIADGFVRIWHPVDQRDTNYSSCSNQGSPTNVKLDAAILTLTGSFTVDNYWCGGSLGTLQVTGAIAQLHRGVVGRGSNGYLKNYIYDENLKYRSPPYFLDPLQSSWRILRQGEQSPPARG